MTDDSHTDPVYRGDGDWELEMPSMRAPAVDTVGQMIETMAGELQAEGRVCEITAERPTENRIPAGRTEYEIRVIIPSGEITFTHYAIDD